MPDDKTPFRWGLLGTGPVARKFALGLAASQQGCQAHLVASRNTKNAARFAADLGVEAAESYAALLASPDIDAVYIATPPSSHAELALAAIAAGKAVLVEKPFMRTAAEAEQVAAAARAAGVFCMEGMWTRFLPAVREAARLIADGAIGEPRQLTGAFASALRPPVEGGPLPGPFRPAPDGGALLHRGVYPVSLARHLLGPATLVHAELRLGEGAAAGIDEDAVLTLRHGSGAISVCRASLRTNAANTLEIEGTAGRLRLEAPIYRPFALSLQTYAPGGGMEAAAGGRLEKIKEGGFAQGLRQRLGAWAPRAGAGRPGLLPYAGNGYVHEADAVARAVRAGLTEAAEMPLDESLEIARLIDAARAHAAP